jgi:hypothetical protein
MDRKQFLRHALQTGFVCCGAITSLKSLGTLTTTKDDPLSADLGRRMRAGAESPAWRRAEKSLSWIKNMVSHLDDQLDEETKIKLLNACGRSCFIFAMGVADERKVPSEYAEGFLKALERGGCKIERNQKTTTIFYSYGSEQNPQGLSMKEGYCLCPIVEDDVPGLSPSFCNCSAGYVKEIIERNSGRQVIRVEVLESIKRGGKECRFKVELQNL